MSAALSLKGTIEGLDGSTEEEHDRPFHNFEALKSVVQRSRSSIERF